MARSSAQLHEAADRLASTTVERHRAVVSLMEELEAVDWYDQRIDASEEPELVAILRHNRDEEKEHASMILEWLRRQDSTWDAHLRCYLFSEATISDVAEELGGERADLEPTGGHDDRAASSLGIGSLRDKPGL